MTPRLPLMQALNKRQVFHELLHMYEVQRSPLHLIVKLASGPLYTLGCDWLKNFFF